MTKEKRAAKKHRWSIRWKIAAIFLGVYLLFILLFRVYVARVIQETDRQLADSYAKSLSSFISSVQDEIQLADEFLHMFWDMGTPGETEEGRQAYSSELLEEEAVELLENNASITAIFACGQGQALSDGVCLYNVSYSDVRREAIEEMVTRRHSAANSMVNGGWELDETSGLPLLVRTMGKGGRYCSVVVDVQNMSYLAVTNYEMYSPIVMASSGRVAADAYWFRSYAGDLQELLLPGYHKIQIGKNQYMVVNRSFMGMTALYGVVYSYDWSWMRLIIVSFLIAIIISMILVLVLLSVSFFSPLGKLVAAMAAIKSGDTSVRADDYSSHEFAYINDMFNEMVDELQNQRIQVYETQLAAKTYQMDALRLQIRRHFFLNCLKNIYAMAETGKKEYIQKQVLLLSRHLRYTLDIGGHTVDLQKELEMCRNYIELCGVGQAKPPALEITSDADLAAFQIPPISILSLVENCYKYGARQDVPLRIRICVEKRKLDEDTFVRILVEDNGLGFAPDVLRRLNSGRKELMSEGHVGINNVMDRIQALYGEECSVVFANMGGASIEIIIPMR